MPLDSGLLDTFVAVVDCGRISAAARRLCLSQPAVTARIRRLEDAVGGPLLLRSAQGVTPTPSGDRLLGYAREVQRLLDDALAHCGPAERLGPLELIASTTLAAHVLPPLLARFRARHQQVALRIESGNTDEAVAAVRSGRFPLGVVEGHARASGLRLEPWLDDEIVPVAGARAPFAPRTIAELAALPILWREPGSGTRAVVARALRTGGVRNRPEPIDLVLGSTDAIAGAAAAGLGIAFLSRWSLGPHLAAGLLRVLPGLDLTVRRTFRFALPAGGLGGTAAHFVDFARRNPPSIV